MLLSAADPLATGTGQCYRGNVPPKAFFTQCPSSEPGSWWRGPSQRTPLSSMQGSGSFLNKNTYMLFLSGILNHLTLIILLFSSSAQSGISRFLPYYREEHVLTITLVAWVEQFVPDYGQKSFSGNFSFLFMAFKCSHRLASINSKRY